MPLSNDAEAFNTQERPAWQVFFMPSWSSFRESFHKSGFCFAQVALLFAGAGTADLRPFQNRQGTAAPGILIP